MKKVLVIIIAFVIFWISYQVRLGFLATGDFNEPSDAKEYRLAAIGTKIFWNILFGTIKIDSNTTWSAAVKHSFSAMNTHGAPLYNMYVAALEYEKLSPRDVAPILHAIFVAVLFWVAHLLFPLPVAVTIGLIGVLYTPIFAFIYSWMPEHITSVVLPLLVCAVSAIVLWKKHLYWFMAGGFILFLMGLTRHIFTYYGFLFIGLLLLIHQPIKRRNVVALVFAYIVPTVVWGVFIKLSGTRIYGIDGITSTLMNAHRLSTDGWWMDGIKGLTWNDVLSKLMFNQNPVSLFLLELERINRLWRHAANSYATSFPFADQGMLQLLHIGILFFAAWGFRAALRNKFLFLISSLIVWNTLFVSLYYVEEIRYQIPVLGILLLLAGAGFEELQLLWNYQTGKKIVCCLSGLFGLWVIAGRDILDIEYRIVPFIADSRVWRGIHFLVAGVIVIWATRVFWMLDRNAQIVIPYKWKTKLLSSVFLIIFAIVIAPMVRSKNWHEWRKPLYKDAEIHQEITLGKNALAKLRDLNGYLIIDIEDPNASQFLRVTLNGHELSDRVPMEQRMSPVDLRAVRQWQRTLPRLGGYNGVEDVLAKAAAWSNFHEWLAIPIQGSLLEKINKIAIKNNSVFGGNPPYFFGDYPPYGIERLYEGPTGRLFQGPRTHNKYQVEGDMRLTERRRLQSIANKSTFVIGRYRIFFLFPYLGGDPEDLF